MSGRKRSFELGHERPLGEPSTFQNSLDGLYFFRARRRSRDWKKDFQVRLALLVFHRFPLLSRRSPVRMFVDVDSKPGPSPVSHPLKTSRADVIGVPFQRIFS